MAWPNPLRKRDENICTAWGYTFQVTAQHFTMDDTASMKMSYDKLGEAAYDRLNGLYPPPSEKQGMAQASEDSEAKDRRSSTEGKSRKRDMFLLLRDHAHEDRVLNSLWTEVNTVPQWVCWDQIARGQEVFYRYGGPALTGLAFQSLLGGMVGIAPQSLYSPH
ncbi:hypothetical protein Q9189_004342 [Teloschistes chrysophthalmus]